MEIIVRVNVCSAVTDSNAAVRFKIDVVLCTFVAYKIRSLPGFLGYKLQKVLDLGFAMANAVRCFSPEHL